MSNDDRIAPRIEFDRPHRMSVYEDVRIYWDSQSPVDGIVAMIGDVLAERGIHGGTIGFAAKDAATVDAWHAAGVANGGVSCEDPPGKRPNGAYLAYLRDPAGNKLCAVYRAG